jgi:37-kD nucleoid-associated bacterial protein
MTVDLSSLEIVQAVVHDVPRPGDPESLVLTDGPVDMDNELEGYFQEKVKESLQGRGLNVQADPEAPFVVRNGVGQILLDPDMHVAASREMAEHLYALQRKTNSPGLLTVIRARAGGEDAIAVLKLEREVGVHVLVEQVGTHRVIDLEYLRDLTLTRKTRVFKAAVLELSERSDPLSMHGVASDDQRSRSESRGLARFFLSDFLGCQLTDSPEKATQEFWAATQTFINEDVPSPERQGRYQVAVQAFLEEPDEDLRPETFIQRAIDQNDQPRLRQRLRTQGLAPGSTFGKDTSLIARKIAGFRLTFKHGMRLIGAREDLEERVDLPAGNGSGPTIINDLPEQMTGR